MFKVGSNINEFCYTFSCFSSSKKVKFDKVLTKFQGYSIFEPLCKWHVETLNGGSAQC